MRPEELLKTLSIVGSLKLNQRHCWVEKDRRESVADHSWRLALLVILLENEPEFCEVDMNKVLRMCLIHDIGEAFSKDIPVFQKTSDEEEREETIYREWVSLFPAQDRIEWMSLLDEMYSRKTTEAKIFIALDKLEAIVSHNESDVHTWLPLEFDLQKTYGQENMDVSPYFRELRKRIDAWTDDIINSSKRE